MCLGFTCTDKSGNCAACSHIDQTARGQLCYCMRYWQMPVALVPTVGTQTGKGSPDASRQGRRRPVVVTGGRRKRRAFRGVWWRSQNGGPAVEGETSGGAVGSAPKMWSENARPSGVC